VSAESSHFPNLRQFEMTREFTLCAGESDYPIDCCLSATGSVAIQQRAQTELRLAVTGWMNDKGRYRRSGKRLHLTVPRFLVARIYVENNRLTATSQLPGRAIRDH